MPTVPNTPSTPGTARATDADSGGAVAGPTGGHRVVSRDEWLRERLALLEQEKAFTRQRDALAAKVRALPWARVEKEYRFDAPARLGGGTRSLGDLFGPRGQLIVYHFMFDPTWSQGCMGCSFTADHYNGIVEHLAHRDISFVTVSRAPVEKIEAFRARMGWTFPWVSGGNTDFGRDFNVSFTDEELGDPGTIYNFNRRPAPIRELPGLSVFARGRGDAQGQIFHTYSTFGRGLEDFLTAYRYMDIAPKGRDEASGEGMGWLRHRDRYDDATFVAPWMERPGVTGPAPA